MKRCRWADPNSELYIAYHDREWGRLEHDDQKLFEMLILEGFQAGLSWLTILKKREAFRRAFDRFDPAAVAQYGPEKVESLMADVGIVRNRRKILASIQNAKIFLAIQEEFGSFDRYLWSFTEGEVIVNTDDVFHTHTDLSDRIPKAQTLFLVRYSRFCRMKSASSLVLSASASSSVSLTARESFASAPFSR